MFGLMYMQGVGWRVVIEIVDIGGIKLQFAVTLAGFLKGVAALAIAAASAFALYVLGMAVLDFITYAQHNWRNIPTDIYNGFSRLYTNVTKPFRALAGYVASLFASSPAPASVASDSAAASLAGAPVAQPVASQQSYSEYFYNMLPSFQLFGRAAVPAQSIAGLDHAVNPNPTQGYGLSSTSPLPL